MAVELARFREDTDAVLELYVRAYASFPDREHRYVVRGKSESGEHFLVDRKTGQTVACFRVDGDTVRTLWVISLQEMEEIYREGLALMEEAGLV